MNTNHMMPLGDSQSVLCLITAPLLVNECNICLLDPLVKLQSVVVLVSYRALVDPDADLRDLAATQVPVAMPWPIMKSSLELRRLFPVIETHLYARKRCILRELQRHLLQSQISHLLQRHPRQVLHRRPLEVVALTWLVDLGPPKECCLLQRGFQDKECPQDVPMLLQISTRRMRQPPHLSCDVLGKAPVGQNRSSHSKAG